MVWFVVIEVFSTLLERVRVGRKSEQEKTLLYSSLKTPPNDHLD